MTEPESILRASGANSVFVRDEATSTNDWAIESARDPRIQRPAIFFARRQTAGRGRNQRTWESSDGSLTFSVLVDRPLSLADPNSGLISMLAADSICEYLESDFGLPAKIKWPNDVILHGRKLAGILIESAGQTGLVIGIGINVRNAVSQISGATSLVEWMSPAPDVIDVMKGTIEKLIPGLHNLSENGDQLVGRCRTRDWLAGKSVMWIDHRDRRPAQAIGLADDGGLKLTISGESASRTVYTGSLMVITDRAVR